MFTSNSVDDIVHVDVEHMLITLFKFITMLCGTNNLSQKIPHIQTNIFHEDFQDYSMEYC